VLVSHRIEVKRTYVNRRTGEQEQVRWSRNRPVDGRMTAVQNDREAHAVGHQAERDLDAGVHPQERYDAAPALAARGMTVGDWAARWRVDRGLSAGAAKAERVHLDRHILPTWRDVPLEDETRLSRLTVQQWVNRMPGAPRSVRLRYGTFTKMINDGIDEPTVPLTASPCVRIRLPAVEPTGRRALTEAEVAAIADACGVHRMLVWTLAFTGCRISELVSRDVSHLHPLSGLVLPPGTRRRGERPAASAPTGRRRGGKTPAAVREIPLCGSHRAELLAYVGDRTSGPLFVGRDGRSRATYTAVWKRIVAACEKLEFEEPVSPHWFRHTHETWLDDDEIRQVAIDERIGHKTKGVQGIYKHVTPRMRASVLSALERRWLAAKAAPAGRAESISGGA
jgi:integrase